MIRINFIHFLFILLCIRCKVFSSHLQSNQRKKKKQTQVDGSRLYVHRIHRKSDHSTAKIIHNQPKYVECFTWWFANILQHRQYNAKSSGPKSFRIVKEQQLQYVSDFSDAGPR